MLPKTVQLRQYDTVRLIPSRFADQQDSVLAVLAEDDAQLQDLFALDNASNQRLLAPRLGGLAIGIDELVFNIPSYHIINAAFCYPRPEGSRFNSGRRGAWYAGFDLATALAEIHFHKRLEYEEIDATEDDVNYQCVLADFNCQLHDLTTSPRARECLNPHSYVASQALAQELLSQASTGLLYPSVRSPGQNLVCFRPALVNNVRRNARFRLSWRNGGFLPLFQIN